MMKVMKLTRMPCGCPATTKVTAVQPAKASAEWPDGSPPESGVPVLRVALSAMTARTDHGQSDDGQVGRRPPDGGEQIERDVGQAVGQHEIGDHQRVDRGDEHGARGQVLCGLGPGIELVGDHVHDCLDWRS